MRMCFIQEWQKRLKGIIHIVCCLSKEKKKFLLNKLGIHKLPTDFVGRTTRRYLDIEGQEEREGFSGIEKKGYSYVIRVSVYVRHKLDS